ncbi:MAG: hypothetical protein FVQ81_09725 [Candidatus Glassbacteria bacterium]|nr:hypothetical protein [Candidatus Glassbacteria bacterium]
MQDVHSPDPPSGNRGTSSIWPPLPSGRLDCYVSLWQLELWLRELVYLELKSRYGTDWANYLVGLRPGPQRADSRLTHMPTRERGPLSYLTFDALIKTISKHRRLFAPYLPVRSVWDARIEEVAQIRNRVAHFRQGHDGDLARVRQHLADIDNGIWTFCTSYNYAHPIYPPEREKVARQFIDLDPFPWGLTGDGALARFGSAPPDMLISVTIEMLRRPWLKARLAAQIAGKYGYLYDVHIGARQNRAFDYANLLSNTKRLHEHCCHIFLDAYAGTLRLTIPSVLGAAVITDTIHRFVEMARHALRPSHAPLPGEDVASVVRTWPEYLLGPDHPFSFLGPDMPCTMFGS